MNRRLVALSFAFLTVVSLGLSTMTACGFEHSESSYTCCINGRFYECPDSDAMNECVEECERATERDDECSD